jgi:hypothetical protein
MNLSRMIYPGKVVFRALLSGFRFNRIRQARHISMDLNSSTTDKQSTLDIEASDTAIDLVNFKRAVSGKDGNIAFFVDDSTTK